MLKIRFGKKGVVLLIILVALLVVVTLAAVVVRTILSNARFTHHQTSRIQAYYAGMAGVNYALQMIRAGSWVVGTSCVSGCSIKTLFAATDFKPPIFVTSANDIIITIRSYPDSVYCPSSYNLPANTGCISVKVNYTYADTL
ncbi:MAG: hypothetical protein PHW54_03820 [Candidatus Omnitrophica bacterium]|nr:hypothetical protein [Candidatus Omnitrophota bacterium]